MSIDREFLLGVIAVVAVDILVFAWLFTFRRGHQKSGTTQTVPLTTLFVILFFLGAAHFFGMNRIWSGVESDARAFDVMIAMVAITILPGVPPTVLFAQMLVASLSELGISGITQMKTARRPEQDYSRAQSLSVKGDIRGALAQYEAYYKDDPRNHKPLLDAYRMLYRVDRREEGARYLRRIMKDFEHDKQVWSHAATELANHLQNDADNPEASKHVLQQIVKQAGSTRWGRLAQARLQDIGPRTL